MKSEVYRVAERFVARGTALRVIVVTNSPIAVPREDYIERVVVGGGMDEADNFIAERAGRGDIVITADVPLAARAVKAGAAALAPNGRPFSEDAIGLTLATRNLMSDLRSAGAVTSGPKPFAPADRSRFLSALDAALTRLTRAGFGNESVTRVPGAISAFTRVFDALWQHEVMRCRPGTPVSCARNNRGPGSAVHR